MSEREDFTANKIKITLFIIQGFILPLLDISGKITEGGKKKIKKKKAEI